MRMPQRRSGDCVLIREALEWNITFSVSIKSTRAYIMHFKSLLCENPFEFTGGSCWYHTEISPTAWIFIEVISLESEQLILCHALASRFMHPQLALRMRWFILMQTFSYSRTESRERCSLVISFWLKGEEDIYYRFNYFYHSVCIYPAIQRV